MSGVVVIVQARMGSSRLPGKVLKPMAGVPMLRRLLDHVRTAKRVDCFVVATSDLPRDDAIAEFCFENRITCHRGSETNVLERMAQAGEAVGAKVIIRLTGDNPLVTGDLVDRVIEAYEESEPRADYVHTLGETGWPYGLAVELITMPAIRVSMTSTDPMDREHVTYHVRMRPEKFRHVAVACPRPAPNVRLTVDTLEDFERVENIVRRLDTDGLDVDQVLAAADPARKDVVS